MCKADENEIQKIKEKYGKFILFVGRLNYYKGLGYLVEAMKDVEAKLIITGEGPEKKNLEFKIKNLKLEDKIYFLSLRLGKELINFYHACSVFVLPSIFKSEAFGIVLIEAMACGKPIVSTELGTGTSFVNQDGVTGFVVPPQNSRALSQAIQKIIENKKLAQEFGQNSIKRVKELFSKEKNLEKIISIYENLL
ncbi:MAG: glycosyltransferase [Candidatus Nealsonbacteria bacterium]|nr:glycosyltransferase [Candidatus Nealsonbacteria bacterium]